MRVGIMQPYFFPYIGYFQLIANTDKWVFFDVVQYNKKSWMNRNRILHPTRNGEYQYINVPIKKHKKGTLIRDVAINMDLNWRQEILGKLTAYRRMRAEHYDETIALLTSIFDNGPASFLEFSVYSTSMVCNHLGIDFNFEIASHIAFERGIIDGPGDWALSITKALGGNIYINPTGGAGIFDEEKYASHGIDLLFLKPKLSPYKQSRREGFLPGLSIIDILMFNEIDSVREFLRNDFELCRKEQLVNQVVERE